VAVAKAVDCSPLLHLQKRFLEKLLTLQRHIRKQPMPCHKKEGRPDGADNDINELEKIGSPTVEFNCSRGLATDEF
jgi:hypothetical protein